MTGSCDITYYYLTSDLLNRSSRVKNRMLITLSICSEDSLRFQEPGIVGLKQARSKRQGQEKAGARAPVI